MDMKRGKCRIWWPKQLLSCIPDSEVLLFGWFFNSSYRFFDIVVATATSPNQITSPHIQSNLKEILHNTNGIMVAGLQDHSEFSILGYCAADCCYRSLKMMDNPNNGLVSENFNVRLQSFEMEPEATSYSISNQQHNQEVVGEVAFTEVCGSRWSCGCHKLDKYLESYRQYSIQNGNWVHLSPDFQGFACKEIGWMPKLHHMHWNGKLFSVNDVHVIIYEQPAFGVHYYSLTSWSSLDQVRTNLQRPKWIHELHKKQPLNDLDLVLLALNSATAAKLFIQSSLDPRGSYQQVRTISRLLAMLWYSMSLFLASIFTLLYIILQVSHRLLSFGTQSLICEMFGKLFSHTWKNVHIRSCQLLYWPIFLQGSGFRSHSNVEYAHRAALRKHSLWSRVAVDILLGNIVGLALLLHEEAVYSWILHLVRNINNNLLRSGCVWLMGVPAGFKLNTELAELLGMISLNAVQIWSTLWFFMGCLVRYIMKGIAISGIVFGVTIPASLCIDMLKLATLHLSTLHWLISILYSHQIQALASLWRLFRLIMLAVTVRGRKWNPLRQRLDSYNYTVEQHVVSSLIFTPLLLLVPTTLVFYIFFTNINASISFLCVLVEITISILHATPYAELFLWMVRPKRFPSGVWFDILSDRSSNFPASPKLEILDGQHPEPHLHCKKTDMNAEGRGAVVSVLCINFSDLGKIVLPHYRNALRGFSPSSSASFAYGILSGQRIPSPLRIGLPPTLPWIYVGFKEYWQLAFDAICACGSNL
ncbi:N-acetylglucosaminyl transferase component [Cinnamomum micranthum f. kanehirae]|uniref:N-acetylglucosaminyl transferase component n=1 Tax=Cinnamomum micranthum f. kanehirae TaxID=337451 RepID=A0A443N7E4_9MAGN|nr:N-acetylglucosaminyl transferase component [Cinnamomum micranthum f. kanehirae]